MNRVKLYANYGEQIANLPGVKAEVERRAKAMEEAARSSAPVETGGYQDSIHTESLSSSEAGYTEIFDRPIARVIADSDHAAAVEGRTRNLGRAADAAGGGV